MLTGAERLTQLHGKGLIRLVAGDLRCRPRRHQRGLLICWKQAVPQLTISRTRPFRRNDNPLAEEKNGSLVRGYFGFARLDTVAQTNLLTEFTTACGSGTTSPTQSCACWTGATELTARWPAPRTTPKAAFDRLPTVATLDLERGQP
jgi:hypothetical protein